MKNQLLLFFMLYFGILFFQTSCHHPSEKHISPKTKLETKHEPSDRFFIQRLGEDGKFSINAYTAALEQVHTQVQTRTEEGFDENWVTQGPANIGARINTIAINPNDENIIYVGFSEGGVFKTTNGGSTWNPIFDDQPFLSIGDIALDPNDPNIVYVGTGDPNISGLPFIGNGVYRSMNGGETWTHLGLATQRIVSKIIIDPTNANTIYTATMGLPFERNSDRGVYRSTDNGDSWEQVLFVSDSTGVIDMVINPNNPQIIYAAGWDRIRNNTESIIKGNGARIYQTTDGGDNWQMLEGGLPNDMPHGRIGLAMYEANPNIIYAEYIGTDSRLEDIYRTNDGGNTWNPIPTEATNGLDSNVMRTFGWYFGKIRVNPTDPDDIYLLAIDLYRSKDAGEHWELASPIWWTYEVHADKHDLDFLSNGNIILATDGGLYKSDANNIIWEDIENIPTTQFYRVAYNPHSPDNYYGGAQDNGTCGGNSSNINFWDRIYGGDGFQTVFDPDNADRFFVETQNGRIKMTLNGGGTFDSADEGIDPDDRRNWDMPYLMSPHNSSFFYTGTYRVYLGVGLVPFWASISEDLTDGTNSPHKEHNISAITESPVEEDLLYVGTGDGNLWRYENEWTSISNNLPDLYVTDVVASPENADAVYVTYSGYLDNSFLPRIHRSMDRGETWENISNNLPDLAINDLLILPEHSDSILFVATDGGVYGSVDAGQNWERLGANMPIVTVYDLAYNIAHNQLVAGTFGRSIMTYPLDSITNVEMPTVATSNPLQAKGIKIMPTVTDDFIYVEIENMEFGKETELVIISTNGQVMHQINQINGRHIKQKLDVSDYPAGQYFVKIKCKHQTRSAAFIKI